jgi:hypothetical protein
MSDTHHLDRIPTVADVDLIRSLSDPVIRNLQITQCYHELSAAMAERTGLSANWCTFATWASKQAGQTIRKEDLQRMFEQAVRSGPATVEIVRRVASAAKLIGAKRDRHEIQRTILDVLNGTPAFARASDATGRGNKKVFEEIGREFARFLSFLQQDSKFDAARLATFCDELRPGEPPEGQRLLRQAFTHCYDALFEADAKRRAELQLLANIEIGFHEQTRLQPEIAEALNAVFVDAAELRNRLIRAIFPWGNLLVRLRLFLTRLWGRPTPLDEAIRALIADMQRKLHLVVTEHMMTIALPGGVRLRLGHDLTAGFPDSLRQITNSDLLALLKRIDPTPESLNETGAIDWADLPDRIHFIVDMFRCYQESRELFTSSFSSVQVADIKAGRLPAGEL